MLHPSNTRFQFELLRRIGGRCKQNPITLCITKIRILGHVSASHVIRYNHLIWCSCFCPANVVYELPSMRLMVKDLSDIQITSVPSQSATIEILFDEVIEQI